MQRSWRREPPSRRDEYYCISGSRGQVIGLVSGEIIRSGVEEDFMIKVDERQFNRQPRHKVTSRLALASLPDLRDSTVNLVPE